MRNILTIAAKDVRSLFVSPIAYVVLTGFLLISGWFFFNLLYRFNYVLSVYSNLQGYQNMEGLNLNQFVMSPLAPQSNNYSHYHGSHYHHAKFR